MKTSSSGSPAALTIMLDRNGSSRIAGSCAGGAVAGGSGVGRVAEHVRCVHHQRALLGGEIAAGEGRHRGKIGDEAVGVEDLERVRTGRDGEIPGHAGGDVAVPGAFAHVRAIAGPAQTDLGLSITDDVRARGDAAISSASADGAATGSSARRTATGASTDRATARSAAAASAAADRPTASPSAGCATARSSTRAPSGGVPPDADSEVAQLHRAADRAHAAGVAAGRRLEAALAFTHRVAAAGGAADGITPHLGGATTRGCRGEQEHQTEKTEHSSTLSHLIPGAAIRCDGERMPELAWLA